MRKEGHDFRDFSLRGQRFSFPSDEASSSVRTATNSRVHWHVHKISLPWRKKKPKVTCRHQRDSNSGPGAYKACALPLRHPRCTSSVLKILIFRNVQDHALGSRAHNCCVKVSSPQVSAVSAELHFTPFISRGAKHTAAFLVPKHRGFRVVTYARYT